MTLVVSQWPFLPEEKRTPEQSERWWAECYIPSPADVTLRGIDHSVIVAGKPGSGKSVALKALEKVEAKRLLMFDYPITRWPGEQYAWMPRSNHLGQIMARASIEIRTFLTNQLDKLNQLSPINLEYLRWLIEKYGDKRAFRRWADAINNQTLLDLSEQSFDDLYRTVTDLSDIQGQIEELVTLSQRLGFEGVAVLVDVKNTEITSAEILEKMKDLFGWLTPLQFEGFAIKAALPEDSIKQAQLINRSRGRISFAPLNWSSEECHQLCNRHLQAATEKKLKTLSDIATNNLLASLQNQMEALYGAHLPRAWVRLTKTLLDQYVKYGRKLTLKQYGDLIHSYFAAYVPLRLDKERRGVWRGIEFIPLDDQPFSFLAILQRYKNGGYDANSALLEIARNQGNLNTIASRLRKKVEPVPKQPVYVHNTRNQGYWLENVIEVGWSIFEE